MFALTRNPNLILKKLTYFKENFNVFLCGKGGKVVYGGVCRYHVEVHSYGFTFWRLIYIGFFFLHVALGGVTFSLHIFLTSHIQNMSKANTHKF